jgi:hypothetical protein
MQLFINQSGRINFEIGIDTNLTTTIQLLYRKPDAVEGEFTPVEVLDATAGRVFYDVQDDELDVVGLWTLWSKVTTIDGTFYGQPFTIDVRPEGDNPVDKAFIKEYHGITDTSQDMKIDANIPGFVDAYLAIRNAPWETDSEGNTIYPANIKTVIAEMYGERFDVLSGAPKLPVAAERIGSYNVSYGGAVNSSSAGLSPRITGMIKKYIKGS